MSYIRRNTTLILFLLLIFSIGFFAASIIFFQGTFTKVNDELRDKKTEILNLNKELESLNLNVSNLNRILEIQLRREENLSDQYVTLRVEKVSLEDEVTEKEQELAIALGDLQEAEGIVRTLAAELEDLNMSYAQILDDLEDVCGESDVIALNLSDCEDYS
jgi:chromosome segregation ATPase